MALECDVSLFLFAWVFEFVFYSVYMSMDADIIINSWRTGVGGGHSGV